MTVAARSAQIAGIALLGMAICGLGQQSSPAKKSPPSQTAPTSSSSPPQPSPYGEVLFSRGSANPTSTDAPSGPPTAAQPSAMSPGSAAPGSTAPGSAAPRSPLLATNAERTALTFTFYDLDVHLVPSEQSLSARVHMSAQNATDQPLHRIVLQISSALQWYSIHVDGKSVKFATEPVASDIDHTGQLTEAVIPLDKPLPAHAVLALDVIYSGKIATSAERLLRLGAPANVADSSEWDRISPAFTGLRGFGNVLWFPVSTAPVLLGQGSEMFDSVGKWKLRQSAAQIKMRVLVEYLGPRPTVAFLNGYVVQPDSSRNPTQPAPDATGSASAPGILRVASFTLPTTTLGFSPLSLFVLTQSHRHFPGLDVYTHPGSEAAATAYQQIVENDRPQIQHWLGPHPKRPVVLADLPESDDLPFEERNLLLLPLRQEPGNDNAGPVMAHMLSHAYFVSPRIWLDEGVAQLMTLLWIEQRAGRATAIGQMDSRRAALALAETSDPGVDPGQSLIAAWSDIFYRDKSSDVLWMLRDLAGDTPFAQALQSYAAEKDREPSYFQDLLQKASGKDLEWFFDDWVYRDHGLPDLHIASAYRRPILTKDNAGRNYLVSVDVQNDSFCTAEVPVTVESGITAQTKRLLVPSHTRAALRVLLDSEPTRVLVNDGSVPEVRTSHHESVIRSANQPIH